MNRREFGRLAAYAAMFEGNRYIDAQPANAPDARFSVMLWTLEKLAPFDRCLEMVAQAGYQGVELVGEFHTWAPEERGRVSAKLRSLVS